MFEDIDEKKRAALELKALAETDPLTGLLNRKTFSERLNDYLKLLPANSHCAFFILDVDNFKSINDNYGHMTGDQLLINIGKAICSAFKTSDLVCRLGGDEFVFSLLVSDEKELKEEVDRIFKLTHIEISPSVITTTSIGIALFPESGSTFSSLYHDADIALYQVKNNGKNGYRFFET